MNKFYLLFGLIFVLCVSGVSAVLSGHLCDAVSDDGRFSLSFVDNPKILVPDGQYSKLVSNGTAVRLISDGVVHDFQFGSQFVWVGSVLSNDGQKLFVWSKDTLFYSLNGGTDWTRRNDGSFSIGCISGDNIVLSGGSVLVSNNGGISFSDKSDYVSYNFKSLQFLNPVSWGHISDTKVVMGGSNLVMSDDGQYLVVARYGVGGYGGAIWYSSSAGRTWRNVPITTNNGLFMDAHWNGLVMSCDGQHVIASNEGYSYYKYGNFWENGDVLISNNFGQDWALSGLGNAGNSVFTGLGMDCDGNTEVFKKTYTNGIPSYIKYSSTNFGNNDWTTQENIAYNPLLGGILGVPDTKDTTNYLPIILLLIATIIIAITIIIYNTKKHKGRR